MLRSVCLLALLFSPVSLYASLQTATAAAHQTKRAANKDTHKPPKGSKPAGAVSLTDVVKAAEFVLDVYNSRPETQSADGKPPQLPPIKTAEFDFKVVTDTKGGPSVNFWIFKAGFTAEKQATSDLTFTYEPLPVKPSLEPKFAPPDLRDELSKAIESAAKAVLAQSGDGTYTGKSALQLKQMGITFIFTIGKDYQGGLNIPIQLVTVGGIIDHSNAATQSVKLTFAFPDQKPDAKP